MAITISTYKGASVQVLGGSEDATTFVVRAWPVEEDGVEGVDFDVSVYGLASDDHSSDLVLDTVNAVASELYFQTSRENIVSREVEYGEEHSEPSGA